MSELKQIAEGYFVRPLTGRECVAFLDLSAGRDDSPQQAIKMMAGCCAIGVVDADNKKVNESADFWLDQPLDLINTLGQAVIANSGLTTVENEQGN